MKTKHTPGPWRLDLTGAVRAERITRVAVASGQDQLSDSEVKANLHLIAAAPDLLEACKNALKNLEELKDFVDPASKSIMALTREDRETYALLKDAIAKAEGVR